MVQVKALEADRVELQDLLDSKKTQQERNRLGQFATPPELARDILEYARKLLPEGEAVRFLDPAFGTGSFYSALLQVFSCSEIEESIGYEIDPHYGEQALTLWRQTNLSLHIEDFTRASPPPDSKAPTLLICNPPYVRHHHMGEAEKMRLRDLTEEVIDIRISGLAGLYCYFLALAHGWMKAGGLAGWLIPSEFLTVNYGRAIKDYLLQSVTLRRVHRFDPSEVQFGDALVSSAVVWFTKSPPPPNHEVEFTFGGRLNTPARSQRIPVSKLQSKAKWTAYPLQESSDGQPFGHTSNSVAQTRLGDLFSIKRGIATGSNDFFVLTSAEVAKHGLPQEVLIPILPSPRYLESDIVLAGTSGVPDIDRVHFLLTCTLSEAETKERYPTVWKYLQEGVTLGIDRRYLCSHRSPWYTQERRPAAPFLCNYMGRPSSTGRTFRFILNYSEATAANVYLLLYPKPALARLLKDNAELTRRVWEGLTQLSAEMLLGEGRVYGGGLYKLEPKELANAPADTVLDCLPLSFRTSSSLQPNRIVEELELFN